MTNRAVHRVFLSFKGETYSWTERGGVVDQDFLSPPWEVLREIHPLLEEALRELDDALTDPHELTMAASWARQHKHYARALRLARRALELRPTHASAAAVLSATLRALGRAREAVEVTETFVESKNGAVLTTRAAALLDLGLPKNVRQLLNRAYAFGKSSGASRDETSAVYARLEKEFPGY